MLAGAFGELREVTHFRMRPKYLGHGERPWPHSPVEIVEVPKVLAPEAALSAEDVRPRRIRHSRKRVETVRLLKRKQAAAALEEVRAARSQFKAVTATEPKGRSDVTLEDVEGVDLLGQ